HRIRAISGIADCKRASNRLRLLRLKTSEIALHAIRDGRATRCLRAEKLHRLFLHPAKQNKFAECLRNFRDERTASHRNDDVVRKLPPKLLGDFVAVRFRSFGVVRPQINVNKAPLEAIRDLRTKTIDVVVVAVDANYTSSVNGSIENFCRL